MTDNGTITNQADGDNPVIVLGGGLAGLAATLWLDRLGFTVHLVAPQAPEDRRTSALLAGSIEFLERLGVWQQIADVAAPMTGIRLVDATHRIVRAPEVLFRAAEVDLPAFGYNVTNAALLAAMERAIEAAGIVRLPQAAVAVAPHRDAVTLTLADGTTLETPLLVAADGRNSLAREAAGIACRRWAYRQSALVCDFDHAVDHDGISTEFHTEAGPTTLVPLADRASSLVLVDRPEVVDRLAELTDPEFAEAVEARVFSYLGPLTVRGHRQVFPLSGLTAHRSAASRTVLLGEASHVFPPIGAQGLNLGLRDVADLTLLTEPAFRQDPGAEPALAAYDRRRRGDILSRTAAVDALNRTLLAGFLPVQIARGAGLFLLDRVPPLRRAVIRQGLASSGQPRPFSGTDRWAAPRS